MGPDWANHGALLPSRLAKGPFILPSSKPYDAMILYNGDARASFVFYLHSNITKHSEIDPALTPRSSRPFAPPSVDAQGSAVPVKGALNAYLLGRPLLTAAFF